MACSVPPTVVYSGVSGSVAPGASGFDVTVTIDPDIWATRLPADTTLYFQPYEHLWLESATDDPSIGFTRLQLQFQTALSGGWQSWEDLQFVEGPYRVRDGSTLGGDLPDILASTISFRLFNPWTSTISFTNLNLYFPCRPCYSQSNTPLRFTNLVGEADTALSILRYTNDLSSLVVNTIEVSINTSVYSAPGPPMKFTLRQYAPVNGPIVQTDTWTVTNHAQFVQTILAVPQLWFIQMLVEPADASAGNTLESDVFRLFCGAATSVARGRSFAQLVG